MAMKTKQGPAKDEAGTVALSDCERNEFLRATSTPSLSLFNDNYNCHPFTLPDSTRFHSWQQLTEWCVAASSMLIISY